MKSFLLTIIAVQILHCLGVPVPEDALRASVLKLNEITKVTNLCGITGRRVANTYRTGKLSYSVDLTFSVKETICSKNSGLEFDDPRCYFRPKNIAEEGFCKSHVEYFAHKVADIKVECEGLKIVDSESDWTKSSEATIEEISESRETSFEEAWDVESKSIESSLEEPSSDQTESEDTSLEETADAQNKSEERSLGFLKIKTRSVETSLEGRSDMRSRSEETYVQESSNENSQSTEFRRLANQHEEYSKEYEDSRFQH